MREAAVIGVPHPKWIERPLAVVVFKPVAPAAGSTLGAHTDHGAPMWGKGAYPHLVPMR